MNITYWIIVTLLFSSCSKTHLRNCKNDYQKSKEKWINNIPNYSQEFKNDIIDKINVSDTVVFARKGTGYHFLLWKENGR